MKILHVSHGYPPQDTGGIETYLRMVVASQQAMDDDVVVLAGSIELRDTPTIERHEFEGTRVLRLFRDDWFNDHYAHSYHPGASQLFADVLQQERPDVVHIHQWIRLSSDLVAQAHALGIPTVVLLHDVYTSCPRAFRVDRDGAPCTRPISHASCASCVPRYGHEDPHQVELGIELFADQYRSELALADRVLVATHVTADLLHAMTGTPRDRFTVQSLPYRQRFQALDRPTPRTDGVVRFGYWGTLTPHKGPQILLPAFRKLIGAGATSVELHVLGPLSTDALRDRLSTLAEGLPVTFHGAFDAEQLIAADLDVAVFPVVCFEGFGLGLAEAFELGIPAIVSDIGALAGRIGNAGIRVPPGDVDALAAAMERMARDANLRRRLAASVPPAPPPPEEHVHALREHYAAVIAAERRSGTYLAPERRAALLVRQRESAQHELREVRGRRDPS